jgi:hypothetical protein
VEGTSEHNYSSYAATKDSTTDRVNYWERYCQKNGILINPTSPMVQVKRLNKSQQFLAFHKDLIIEVYS